MTLTDIDNAMKKMKRGKGDGYDGLTNDYLISGTNTIFYNSLSYSWKFFYVNHGSNT